MLSSTMKRTVCLAGFALFASINGSAHAIEASAVNGPQAAQAAVTTMNNTTTASIVALQAELTGFTYCSNVRKFYAPTDPLKDANGCVGIQDYPLTMNNTTGQIVASFNGNSNYALTGNANAGGAGVAGNAPNNWGGVFSGQYGVYGTATAGYGVQGSSSSNWSGFFNGSSGVYGAGAAGYGVQGSSTNNWGGVFSGVSGVSANGTNGIGVQANSTNSYGVLGVSTNSWAGIFSGAAGVQGNASTANWGGFFTSPNYGVYGSGATYGVYSAGPLCVNGSCINSWADLKNQDKFGGVWNQSYLNGNYQSCGANPYTGGCGCPSGYNQSQYMTGAANYSFYMYECWK
jgi:hypothetical protein